MVTIFCSILHFLAPVGIAARSALASKGTNVPTDTSPYAGNARLRAHDDVVQPEEFVLGGNLCRIGRDSKNDIVIVRGAVSRQHAVIEQHNNHFVLRDLGSSNGTFVNGERVTERALEHGDVLSFGGLEVTVQLAPA